MIRALASAYLLSYTVTYALAMTAIEHLNVPVTSAVIKTHEGLYPDWQRRDLAKEIWYLTHWGIPGVQTQRVGE